MARILGFQYGEMRGKLGGNVFSRNKAGAYVRAKVTPVNPQTVIQQEARYRFGNMSILFQSLTTTQKGCWQIFASTHFNPLKGNNTGIYTAGNAFVALRQSAGQGNTMRSTPTGTAGATALTFAPTAYLEAVEPPDYAFGATLQDSAGIVREVSVTPLQLTNGGEISIGLTIPSGATDPTNTINQFIDAEGVAWGLSAYVSNPLKFEGSRPNTTLKANLWDTGVISSVEKGAGPNGFTVADDVTINIQSNVNAADQKNPLCAGDVVKVTIFARSEYGAQKLMNSSYLTVQAS